MPAIHEASELSTSIDFSAIAGRFTAKQRRGRNITNQIRIVGGIDFNNNTGFVNEPRIWGLQFKAKF